LNVIAYRSAWSINIMAGPHFVDDEILEFFRSGDSG
jgi:hypothetical protein